MGEITMSAKELLYAGAQLGADRFYGIPDPFYPMTQQQLLGEIPRLQSALEKRGLASMGFDGSFTLKEEVRALVGPCAGCRTYLLLDQKSAPRAADGVVLYRRVSCGRGDLQRGECDPAASGGRSAA